MYLSDHFTLEELSHSDTAVRLGIPNIIPPALIPAAKYWCLHIGEPVRQHFQRPIRVNSFYRCPALNKAVGSKPTGQHPKCEAGDIEIEGVSNYDLADFIRRRLIFDQLILENHREGDPNSGWVHVSGTPRIARKEVLTMIMRTHGRSTCRGC
jgi:zinc D-Ala-D-Ala carboxypeptidase